MITCAHCRYFRPDEANPVAAMGYCRASARRGYWYPDEKHRCEDYSDTPNIRKQERAIDPR